MYILNRHVYRSSNHEDDDKPVLTIPFSSLLAVITAHELQCNETQIRRNIFKRPLDGSDPNLKNNKERIAANVSRLKRTRIA